MERFNMCECVFTSSLLQSCLWHLTPVCLGQNCLPSYRPQVLLHIEYGFIKHRNLNTIHPLLLTSVLAQRPKRRLTLGASMMIQPYLSSHPAIHVCSYMP